MLLRLTPSSNQHFNVFLCGTQGFFINFCIFLQFNYSILSFYLRNRQVFVILHCYSCNRVHSKFHFLSFSSSAPGRYLPKTASTGLPAPSRSRSYVYNPSSRPPPSVLYLRCILMRLSISQPAQKMTDTEK